ncbi:MAG: hypothetical protein WDN69_32465 [Aliidongia sp.]
MQPLGAALPDLPRLDTLAWRVPDRSAARPLDPAHGLPPAPPPPWPSWHPTRPPSRGPAPG